MSRARFEVKPFPRERHDIVDALEVGVRRHMVHALLELDVTRPRQLIRDHEASTGERLSFTAFIVASLARAVDADKRLHAYRDWRGRLVLFDEVDVVTLVEPEVDAVAIPHVIRAANRRTLRDIHDELRRVQARPAASAQRSGALARLSAVAPGFLRRLFFRALRRDPHWLKRTAGTTLVTAVGMFGSGAAWAVGIVPLHTLALTLGGITPKPGLVEGRVEPREYLSLTASIDHDIVDGAPAARFAKRLRDSSRARRCCRTSLAESTQRDSSYRRGRRGPRCESRCPALAHGCRCAAGSPRRSTVAPSKSSSMRTAGASPITAPSCPGSIATTCGATSSRAQPSGYSIRIAPLARKPTCPCMQRSVPTSGFMSTDQRNPGGYTTRFTRAAPARPISSRTPPTSLRVAPRTGSIGAAAALESAGPVGTRPLRRLRRPPRFPLRNLRPGHWLLRIASVHASRREITFRRVA